MKKANFIYTFAGSAPGKIRKILGCVSLNQKGRVTISFSKGERKNNLSSNLWAARNAATCAIKNDFQITKKEKGLELFDIITEVAAQQNADSIEALRLVLDEYTQDLRKAYILHIRQNAVKTWKKSEQKIKMTNEQWIKEYDIKFELETIKTWEVGKFISKQGTKMVPVRDFNYKMMRENRMFYETVAAWGTFKKYEAKEVKMATMHFNDGILKLATRLHKMNVKAVGMNITSSRVGINIDMWIDTNVGKIHAWTIIAEGPIQHAHYRYLVK